MAGFSGRSVLVAGGSGLIGRPLVDRLQAQGAKVRVVSLDDPSLAPPGTDFHRLDLTDPRNCATACKDIDDVFMLLCVKGSPAVATAKPETMLVPNLLFSLHMLEAARKAGVKRYLQASSLAVYAPAEVFCEDDVWTTFPSPNDRYAGWAKRIGELHAEACRVEHGWNAISVVRPANTYGPFDDFTSPAAMVVPSLIRRAVDGEDPLTVWGDGSAVRDFIHAADVARAMTMVMEKGETRPVNVGSGSGAAIRDIVDIIVANLKKKPKVAWDTSKPSGDARRVLDTARARGLGFMPEIGLEQGIAETMDWYRTYRGIDRKRHSYFQAEARA